MSVSNQFGDVSSVKREIQSEYDRETEVSGDEEMKATVSLNGCLVP